MRQAQASDAIAVEEILVPQQSTVVPRTSEGGAAGGAKVEATCAIRSLALPQPLAVHGQEKKEEGAETKAVPKHLLIENKYQAPL